MNRKVVGVRRRRRLRPVRSDRLGGQTGAPVHRGPVGRITVLVVDQGHRRRGIATQLLHAAEQALASAGCTTVEVMSDIEVENDHNFFRALKFAQTSYRFSRKLPSSD